MFEELKSAGDHLRLALERYFRVCSMIHDNSLQGVVSGGSPVEYAEKIEDAVALAETYDVKLQRAKRAILMARNNAFYLCPINSLPSEILTRILYFVSREDWSNIDYAAQVCSQWRSVAIRSCSLWSYILYCPHANQSSSRPWRGSLDRLQLHTSRAGRLLLDVEIYVDPSYCDRNFSSERSRQAFATIAPRMRSLILVFDTLQETNIQLGRFSEDLKVLLLAGSQGPLTYFRASIETPQGFITALDEDAPTEPVLTLGVSQQQLEAAFASITRLELNGLMFNWTSSIYHGLVDLHLDRSPFGQGITELQLLAILQASPRLRTLRFDILIRLDTENGVPHPLVSLKDLETLRVSVGTHDYGTLNDAAYLLRLVAPGPKPLELSLSDSMVAYRSLEGLREIEAFFARSNIVNLYLWPHAFFASLSTLSPNLKVLKLWNCENDNVCQPSWSSELPTFAPKLEFFSIDSCSMQLDYLLSTIDRYSREVNIKSSSFYQGEREVDLQVVKRELLAINPQLVVNISGQGRVKRTYDVWD